MASEQFGIIYLQRNGLQVYEESIGKIVTFPFPQEVVRDVEIINKDALIQQIGAFIQENHLTPANVVIILAENIFLTKDFIPPQTGTNDIVKKQFLDTLPFEEVVSLQLSLDNNGEKIIGTNARFIEVIQSAFTLQGFSIVTVSPAYVLGATLQNGLTAENIEQINKNISLLKQYALVTIAAPISMTTVKEEKKEPRNNRLIAFIIVFLILLLILFVVLFFSMQSS